ncbi:phosphoenolpyruvate--protein phosphotransferase [Dethiosulfovibrio salsuginis]|uniref:Phosphoenolpyruvate-protein phosphotransferase n=1 Tax=Dethiosulfovibrio salsuginis TaxID=561720 RepID=A0A1X7JXR2_9BACT|nr:phosphoenolpyruvate--protein phosphotransferase [Dethiosulfovibrio salsuginis]
MEMELDRLNAAVEVAGQEIQDLYKDVASRLGRDEVEMFACHGMMIADPEFIGQIKGRIITESVNAEWAVRSVADKFIQVFEDMDDDYLKSKADDVKDVSARICKLLLHIEGGDMTALQEKSIVVARNFTASEVVQIDRDRVLGVVSQEGTMASHAVIMARNWGVPAVIDVPNVLDVVETGDMMIVDGSEGVIILNPDEETLETYRKKQVCFSDFDKKLSAMKMKQTLSMDGIPFKLYANSDNVRDVHLALEKGVSGIGLFRTERLYMDRDRLPTESEQLGVYKKAVLDAGGKTVVFRTLDIGCDKVPGYLNVPDEDNPALGYRAIRFSLSRADIFRIQIRALLRASAFGKVKIMFPMVSGVEELRLAKGLVEDVKGDLKKEGVPFNPDLEIGVMIEVPSAAVISDLIAREVDFMSIGTNDLIQYTLAVDRMNRNLSHLFSPFHPGVLRLVKTVIDNGKKEGVKVSLCGEMAGDPLLIPVLVGMGLERFSMNVESILRSRWIISQIDRTEMRSVVEQILSLSSVSEIRRFCEDRFDRFKQCVPEL